MAKLVFNPGWGPAVASGVLFCIRSMVVFLRLFRCFAKPVEDTAETLKEFLVVGGGAPDSVPSAQPAVSLFLQRLGARERELTIFTCPLTFSPRLPLSRLVPSINTWVPKSET